MDDAQSSTAIPHKSSGKQRRLKSIPYVLHLRIWYDHGKVQPSLHT